MTIHSEVRDGEVYVEFRDLREGKSSNDAGSVVFSHTFSIDDWLTFISLDTEDPNADPIILEE